MLLHAEAVDGNPLVQSRQWRLRPDLEVRITRVRLNALNAETAMWHQIPMLDLIWMYGAPVI